MKGIFGGLLLGIAVGGFVAYVRADEPEWLFGVVMFVIGGIGLDMIIADKVESILDRLT